MTPWPVASAECSVYMYSVHVTLPTYSSAIQIATPRLCNLSDDMKQVVQPCDTDSIWETNTGWLCHYLMIVLDAFVDIPHNCLRAGAKLELHHSHCSLVLPVQKMKQWMNTWDPKPSNQEEAHAVLQSVYKPPSLSNRAKLHTMHWTMPTNVKQNNQHLLPCQYYSPCQCYSCSSPLG